MDIDKITLPGRRWVAMQMKQLGYKRRHILQACKISANEYRRLSSGEIAVLRKKRRSKVSSEMLQYIYKFFENKSPLEGATYNNCSRELHLTFNIQVSTAHICRLLKIAGFKSRLPQYMIALRRHYINWTTGLNNFQ
jgi:transposase